MIRNNRATLAILVAFALLGFVPSATAQVDDTALFSTAVPPNVMLLVDNSGSMHHIVWHPDFPSDFDPTDTVTNPGACNVYVNDNQYFYTADTTITQCGKTVTLWYDAAISPNSQRIMGSYLNWLFSPQSDPFIAEYNATTNGTRSACVGGGSYSLYRRSRITAAQDILREVICQVNAAGEVRFGLAQFRRPVFPDIDTASSDPNGGYVVVPIDDYLDSGGAPNTYLLNGVSQSHGDHLDDAIDDLTGESWTPLAETLLSVYTYFMSRDVADRPLGQDGVTVFPEYEYTTDQTSGQGGPFSGAGAPTVPDSPVEWLCQKNFVIIITDGEPTRDDFDLNLPTNTAIGFADFNNLIGDFNADAEVENPGGFAGCTTCEATRWLDDIALFMNTEDFRPDMADHNGSEQTIDTYTVGFTTSDFANEILLKTAQVGNGQFYFSTDPEALAADIIAAISDIIQKSQSFTAATVPAARTSAGGQFYTSLFVPSDLNGYWEGHLNAWEITSDGDILDSLGNCALDDPLAPTECSAGAFLASAVPFWDAGAVLSSSTVSTRNLEVSLGGTKQSFDTANAALDAAALGLSAADIATYDFSIYTPPVDANELRTLIIDNVRGCELGTSAGGCVRRPWLLGDIFHSEPVLVPGPSGYLQGEAGHVGFRTTYGNLASTPRDRVIVAGANDGFLHIFHAGDWDTPTNSYDPGTGVEIAGFMPYAARQNAKELARDDGTRDFYFVDGSPSIADVWFYPTTTTSTQDLSGSEWRTVLVSGMRQGGNQLFALDVTDPDFTGACVSRNPLNPASSGYPCYLWEFPAEGATGDDVDYAGQSWSDPVITKIKVRVGGNDNGGAGFDRWVAIFGTGYAPESDPNDHASYDALATAGRAIVIVDIQTGAVIARKKFDPSGTGASTDDPAGIAFNAANPEQNMHFAFAATPGVYDLDDDGYADTIMAPDLGGNVWKWVLKDLADATGNEDQTGNWDFSLFFQAPSHVDTAGTGLRHWKSFFYFPSATQKNGALWIALGSGERMNLPFQGLTGTDAENNRIYAIRDTDPTNDQGIAATITEADLVDATNDATGNVLASAPTAKGYYIIGEDGEKWVTETDIFFFVVLGASYIPEPALSPCENGGRAKLYAFTLYNGAGLFTDATSDPVVAIDLGDGLPTAPQVSISTDPDGDTKVIINNQDGELIDPTRCNTPPCPCDNSECPDLCPLPCFQPSGQVYWLER